MSDYDNIYGQIFVHNLLSSVFVCDSDSNNLHQFVANTARDLIQVSGPANLKFFTISMQVS